MPFGVVTETGPAVMPAGTVAWMVVGLTTVNEAAGAELNLRAVAPVKFVPVITIAEPATP